MPCVLLLVCAGSFAGEAAGQSLPVPLSIEGRIGYAFPTGSFATEAGARAESGPGFGAAVSSQLLGIFGLYAGYQRISFGCSPCEAFDLDGSMISRSVEAGVQVRPEVRFIGIGLWGRGGVVHHTLAFSGDGDDVTSESGFGFGAAVGGAARVAPMLELRPSLRLVYAPAEFDFSFGTSRSVDVTAVVLELGAALTF